MSNPMNNILLIFLVLFYGIPAMVRYNVIEDYELLTMYTKAKDGNAVLP